MTPDEIDRLTIAEVRAINERAEAALRTLRELGLATSPGRSAINTPSPQRADIGTAIGPTIHAQPFPCATCGRVAPERPGEPLQAAECQACGNHLPGVALLTNKGPVGFSAEEMARRRSLPAFDANGNPTPEV